MASGVVHNTVTVASAATVGTFLLTVTTLSINLIVWVVLGCLLGIYINPDLDMPTYTRVENKLRKSRNPIVGFLGHIYIMFWFPYAWMIPHRAFLSHAPIVGTLFRLVYILAFVTALVGLASMLITVVPSNAVLIFWSYLTVSPPVIAAVAGLMISDFMHWVFDGSWWRKLSRITGVK